MKYGICTGIENAGLVKKLGYDYIELSVTKTMGLAPEAYAAGKKALEESGLEAECFNILFPKTMNFVDGRTTSLDELGAYLEKALAMVADLHGKVVVFGSGKCRTCPPEVRYLDAYKNLVKACRLTGEIAGKYGIKVVIEPLSRKETNMICTVAEGALLQQDVANEHIRRQRLPVQPIWGHGPCSGSRRRGQKPDGMAVRPCLSRAALECLRHLYAGAAAGLLHGGGWQR